ncbi:hypothetical protein Scep_022373 [Stephania cephalantha]|uniref:Uncharacterized protein n=1 Tax=Stephania cephalantha TaxID=152367 RepID=A0AAP0F617_9MAGN
MAVAAAAGSGVTTGSGMAATNARTATTAIGSDRAGQRRSAAETIGSGGAAATTAAVASAVARCRTSVHSNNEVVKRERQEEAAIAPPSSSSSSKQGDSTSAPKITMRDRDEVLEKLWSKYFERISRGEGSGHDSLSVHSNNEEVKREKQEEDVIASPSSKHGNNDDITSAPAIMTMRERDEVLEKLWSKYFERISRGERSAHDSLKSKIQAKEIRFHIDVIKLLSESSDLFRVNGSRNLKKTGVILEEIHFLNNNNFTPYTLPGLLEWCTSENNRGSAVPRGILFTLVLKNAGSLSSPKADISVL